MKHETQQSEPDAREPSADERLDSWKEIAGYLKRGVSTVQRWERSEGLPVRRRAHSKLASVYAYRSELDAWWNTSRARLQLTGDDIRSGGWRIRMMGSAAVVCIVAVISLAVVLRPAAQEAPLRKFAFSPGAGVFDPVISPDGRHIAYVAQGELWVQDLYQHEPRQIAGRVYGPGQYTKPFWSPGSDFLAFADGTELKKISVSGGQPSLICRLPVVQFEFGSWSPDGSSIVFSIGGPQGHRLYEAPAQGGVQSLFMEPQESDRREDLLSPRFLPVEDGEGVLLFARSTASGSEILLHNLNTGEDKILGKGFRPVYSPSGHIVYATSPSEGGLWAFPFSIATLQPTGEPFSIAENAVSPSVAADGTLVYLDRAGAGARQLVWRDRAGGRLDAIGEPQEEILMIALSPDEKSVAVSGTERGNQNVWIHHTDRAVKIRVTFDEANDRLPVWSPSGDQVAFSTFRYGDADILRKPVDGSGEASVLLNTEDGDFVNDWSPDGNYILFTRYGTGSPGDIWYLRRKDDSGEYEAVPFVQNAFAQWYGQFSPDGRFVAYTSDQSGRREVYVRRFPGPGAAVQVSDNGGNSPRWRKDGKELYYRELFYRDARALVAVPVTTTPNFRLVGSPSRLFPLLGAFDVSADGQRFVVAEPVRLDSPPLIRVVQNWDQEFVER